jgi:hypothetical protein
MIELYNLDSLDYAALRQKMIDGIPRYSRNWTNFNSSDPGITIVELLCFVSDTLLYRTNRIPDESWVNFLRLVAGATRSEIDLRLTALRGDGNRVEYRVTDSATETVYLLYLDQPFIDYLLYLRDIEAGDAQTILEMQRAVLTFLGLPYRAIVADDFHQLAIRMTAGEKAIKTDSGSKSGNIPAYAQVARTWVDSSGNRVLVVLITGAQFAYDFDKGNSSAAQFVYRRVTQDDDRNQRQSASLVIAYSRFMASRLIAGTAFEARAQEWTSVYLEIDLRCEQFATPALVMDAVQKKVVLFLDPVQGGWQGTGWAYNEPVIPEVVENLVNTVEGVAHVNAVRVNEAMQINDRAAVGLTCLLGVTPAVEATGSDFRGLPRLEQLIVTAS